LSSSSQPGHANFILVAGNPYDWQTPPNDDLWQKINGVNNPCPTGYRLPTEAEWNAERQSWVSNDASGAFGSPLKLPLTGSRDYSSGSLGGVGSLGIYWSSSVAGSLSRFLGFGSSNADLYSDFRAYGLSVRCIKD